MAQPFAATAHVVGKKGAILRQGVEMDSPAAGELPRGTRVALDGRATTSGGVARYRVAVPTRGWCSARARRPGRNLFRWS